MIIFAFLIFCAVVNEASFQVPPSSVCPGIFKYEFDGARFIGVVEAPDPPPYGSRMEIQIKMAVRSQIPSDYVGKIELYDDIYAVVQMINRKQPIKYRINFPNVSVLPHIVRVTFADEVICQGPPVLGGVVTLIDLEHVLHSGESALKNSPKSTLVYSPLPPATSTFVKPYERIQPASYTANPANPALKDVCGTTGLVNRMMFGTEITSKGDWPWIVAIFTKKPAGLEFKCAGSLISDKYVATAAHCVTKKRKVIRAADIILRLGVYNLHSWTEESAVTKSVSEINVYSSYGETSMYSDDIAILSITVPVLYTDYIRPVCLWTGDADLDAVVGTSGTVVGWGRDELGSITTAEPKMAEVPIVSQNTCLASKSDFFSLTSNKTLCAGKRDGSGPCNGDSGGGLYVQQGHRWALRGIVSISLKDAETGSCNLKEYIVYTDASKYTSWINEI